MNKLTALRQMLKNCLVILGFLLHLLQEIGLFLIKYILVTAFFYNCYVDAIFYSKMIEN